MNEKLNTIPSEQKSIEEIILTSDDDEEQETIFESTQFIESSQLKLTSKRTARELEISCTETNDNNPKNSYIMLNDSSLIKTPVSNDSNFVLAESDTENFYTPLTETKNFLKKPESDDEIEFCYVNSDEDDENNDTLQEHEDVCVPKETQMKIPISISCPLQFNDETSNSNLGYQICREAASKIVAIKKFDHCSMRKSKSENLACESRKDTSLKLPIYPSSIQTLELTQNEFSSPPTKEYNSSLIESQISLLSNSQTLSQIDSKCFKSRVILKKIPYETFLFYYQGNKLDRSKLVRKRKFSIAYKNDEISEPESANSNSSSEWSLSSKSKKSSKSKTCLNASIRSNSNLTVSSSNTSIRKTPINFSSPIVSNIQDDEPVKKKSKQFNDKKQNEYETLSNRIQENDIFTSENIVDILNEDANLDFNANYDNSTFEVSEIKDGKLKIKKRSKANLQHSDDSNLISVDSLQSLKEASDLDENSNHTITLSSSSRSCSPAMGNQVSDSEIRRPLKRQISENIESEVSDSSVEMKPKKTFKQNKKSENLLKSTLKKTKLGDSVAVHGGVGGGSKELDLYKSKLVKSDKNVQNKQSEAKKIVKKAISQSTKSPVKNQNKSEAVASEQVTEKPKFKIPKLLKPVDDTENLIIKPTKIQQQKDDKKEDVNPNVNAVSVKKQKTNETQVKSLTKINKDSSTNKKKEKNLNANGNVKTKKTTSDTNSEIAKLISSIPDVQNNQKKFVNKKNKILSLVKSKPILTLSDLHQKRAAFNKSIGANYPYFSLLYLMDEYVKKLSTVACLDFNLLISYLPPDESELSITHLDQNKQIQLCKLISRSAGKINVYKMFNLDCLLREYPIRYEANSQLIKNQKSDDDLFVNLIDSMSLSQVFILYKRFVSQLNTPFRTVESVRIGNTNYESLLITFENDCQVDSYDLSIESVVFSSLHKELKKFKFVNSFIHQNCSYESEPTETIENRSEKLTIRPDLYDELRLKVKDDQLLYKMFTKSVYEKSVKIKMSSNFYKTCQTERNKKPVASNQKNERFLNHITSIRSERGKMRTAEKHKAISDSEFNYRLHKLQTDQDIQVDLSNLFQEKNTK